MQKLASYIANTDPIQGNRSAPRLAGTPTCDGPG